MAKVLVVGAGLAGMAAAMEASRAGHDVAMVDATSPLGGRGTSIEEEGWILDPGPHLLRKDGIIWDWMRKASKVEIATRRVDPRRIITLAQGKFRALPISAPEVERRGIKGSDRRRLLGLARFLSAESRKSPNRSFEEWVKDQPSTITEVVECLTQLTHWSATESLTLSSILPRVISPLRGDGLRVPLGGWAEVSGRFLTALDAMEVPIRASSPVRRLLKDKLGKVRGARLGGNIKVEADAVVLAIPPKPLQDILVASRLHCELPAIESQTADIRDLMLSMRAFEGVHALLSRDHGVALLNMSEMAPERMEKEYRESSSMLSILSHNGFAAIDDLLDVRLPGWRRHVIKDRTIEGAVISHQVKGEVGQPLIEQGVAFAGEWVEGEIPLAEGAFQSGLNAAKAIEDFLST